MREIVLPPHFDKDFVHSLHENNRLVSFSDQFQIVDQKATSNLEREQKRASLTSY